MCTAFVYKGSDRICGFNMDLPAGLDWKLFMDRDYFYVGLRPEVRPELLPAGTAEIPEEYLPCDGEWLKIHGVSREGCFGNQLNALSYTGAPFEVSADAVPLYGLVDRFIVGKIGIDDIINTARHKRIVNMPGGVGMTDPALHSLLSDGEGRVLMVEPGIGCAEITANYAAMSNFTMLRLPGDMTVERFGYYGMDRYGTVVRMIEAAGDDFTPEYGLSILNAVKQERYAPTRVSFVYSQNENRVYYALERDFAHIKIQSF